MTANGNCCLIVCCPLESVLLHKCKNAEYSQVFTSPVWRVSTFIYCIKVSLICLYVFVCFAGVESFLSNLKTDKRKEKNPSHFQAFSCFVIPTIQGENTINLLNIRKEI